MFTGEKHNPQHRLSGVSFLSCEAELNIDVFD